MHTVHAASSSRGLSVTGGGRYSCEFADNGTLTKQAVDILIAGIATDTKTVTKKTSVWFLQSFNH